MKIYPQDRGMDSRISLKHVHNHVHTTNAMSDAVLIYAKQENEEVFHPLHLVPPSLVGLAVAVRFGGIIVENLVNVFMFSDPKQVQIRGEEHSSHLQEMQKRVSLSLLLQI